MTRRAPRRPHRLTALQEGMVYAAVGGLGVTGVAWLILHNFVRAAGEFGSTQSPFERPMLVLHGCLSFAFLFILGAIFERHVRAAWNFKANRVTGIALLSLLGLCAVTAAGLYYLASDQVRAAASVAHWGAGLATLLVLTFHAVARKSDDRGPRRPPGARNKAAR